MGKARLAAKYSAAGALTALYGLAGYRILAGKTSIEPISREKGAATAAILIATTWLATTL